MLTPVEVLADHFLPVAVGVVRDGAQHDRPVVVGERRRDFGGVWRAGEHRSAPHAMRAYSR